MRKSFRIAGVSLLAAATLTATGFATAQAAAPPRTIVKTVQAPPTVKIVPQDKIRVVYQDRIKVVYQAVPVPAASHPTAAVATVNKFYQHITDRNYRAAWEMGGKYIGGHSYPTYRIWAAAYSATVSVTPYGQADLGSGRVRTYLSALQADGTIRTYVGAYTVRHGAIVAAHLVQTS